MTRPPIPKRKKFEVRKNCYYGCVICGLPGGEYAHVIPYSECREHTIDNIVLLCPTHHEDYDTKKIIPRSEILTAQADPFIKRQGCSVNKHIYFSGDKALVRFAQNEAWCALAEGATFWPIVVRDKKPIEFEFIEGHLLLNAEIHDDSGRLVFEIYQNEMVFHDVGWDIEWIGQRIIVRDKSKEQRLKIILHAPDCIDLKFFKGWVGDLELEINETEISINGEKRNFRGNNIGWSQVGLVIF